VRKGERQTDAYCLVQGRVKPGFDPHQGQEKIESQQGQEIAERFSHAYQYASCNGKMGFIAGGLLFYEQGQQELDNQTDGDGYANEKQVPYNVREAIELTKEFIHTGIISNFL